ncbi:hypothetical protein CCP3SC5AM1_70043 [Gammaproteobacteria bacterium]
MARTVTDLATVATGMQAALREMSVLMRDSSVSMGDRQERTVTDLAVVMARTITDLAAAAGGMQAALREMGMLMRDSSVSMSDRQDRTLADLSAVAEGMRNAQMELAALLRDSSAGFAGNMARTVTDLATVAESMKSAQGEMVTMLSQTAIGFGGQLNQTLTTLSQSSHAMMAAQEEMQRFLGTAPQLVAATEKLLERFQGGVSEKLAFLDQTQMRVRNDNDAMLQSLIQFMEQSRSEARQDSGQLSASMVSAGQLFLNATEKLEETMFGLANFFSNFLDHFSQNNTEMTAGLHHLNNDMISRFAETCSTLDSHIEQQRINQMEELFRWMQEIKAQSGIAGQTALREAIAPLSHAIGELTVGIVSTKTDLVAQLSHLMETMIQFSNSFGQAQNRFGHLIEIMESGAMMMEMAGEKLQNSTTKMEAVADALSATQETARQTLGAILNAYEQLRVMWHDYENRFEQVNNSLERTFIHLKSGLQMFSERVANFVNGVNQMGNITEKLSYVIGGFGVKLDSMNGTMNVFLEKMPDQSLSIQSMHDTSREIAQVGEKIHSSMATLNGLTTAISMVHNNTHNRDNETIIHTLSKVMSVFLEKTTAQSLSLQSMEDTSRQIAQAGEKIHASIENLTGLAAVVSTAHGNIQNQYEETKTIIGETYNRIQSMINLMQSRMDTTLNSHQVHFNQVNNSIQESMSYTKRHIDRVSTSMQQTMAYINNDLSEFSSEKILEFIGGVDEHMGNVSRQLREATINFNGRLNEINDLIISILERGNE